MADQSSSAPRKVGDHGPRLNRTARLIHDPNAVIVVEAKGQYKKGSDIVKAFLESPGEVERDANGNITRASQSRLLDILDAMVKTASDRRHPQHIQAALGLIHYGYGKPKPSDEETERQMAKTGITMVYVDRPRIDPDIPIAKPELEAPPPDFITAEFTEDRK